MNNTERVTSRDSYRPAKIPADWLAAMHNIEDAQDRVDDLRFDVVGLLASVSLTEYERELLDRSRAEFREAESALYRAASLVRAALQNYAADGNLPGMARRQ